MYMSDMEPGVTGMLTANTDVVPSLSEQEQYVDSKDIKTHNSDHYCE